MTAAQLRRASGVDDVHALARRALPRAVLDFIEGGAEDELTIARNRSALQDLAFVPRVLTEDGRKAVEGLAESLDERAYREDEGFFDRLKQAFR